MIKFEPGEKIEAEVRKHWFIILLEGITLSFVALIPFLGLVLVVLLTPISIDAKTFYLFSIIYLFFILLLWIIFFWGWTSYYLDVWIITNRRIIHTDQISFFNREISNFRLERIQDVTVEIPGFFATMLRFGHIHVQTAGQGKDFILNYATDPDKIKKIILRVHDRAIGRFGEKTSNLNHSPAY
ncbi:MAG: PH domain-containing protein [Patescibacteria group bacterium]